MVYDEYLEKIRLKFYLENCVKNKQEKKNIYGVYKYISYLIDQFF